MSAHEFTHPFQVDKLGPNPKKLHVEANADDLKALCERFELQAMTYFKGNVVLERLSGKKIEGKFEVSTEVTQECVVTFKPLVNKINLEFSRIYDSSLAKQDDEKEIEIADPQLAVFNQQDEITPLFNEKINIGVSLTSSVGEIILSITPL